MQMRPPDARMQYSCSYKCGHGNNGYEWVCRRTWQNHQRLSAASKVHSCIQRSLEGQRAAQQSGPTHCLQGAQNVICTCLIFGGRQWRNRNTVARHLRQQLLREHMVSSAQSLLESRSTTEEDGRPIFCEGFVQPMGNMEEGQG